MKRNTLILTAAALVFSLASCSSTTETTQASVIGTSGSSYVVSATPATKVPLYYVNNVALHHYDPSLYTPFAYDHRGSNHNNYFRNRSIREAAREADRGSVQVGTVEEASE